MVSRLQNESLLIWKTELAMWSGVQAQRDDEPSCQHYPNAIPTFVTIIPSESTLISAISKPFLQRHNLCLEQSEKARLPLYLIITSRRGSYCNSIIKPQNKLSLLKHHQDKPVLTLNTTYRFTESKYTKALLPLFASTMPDRSRAWGQNRSRVVKADPA